MSRKNKGLSAINPEETKKNKKLAINRIKDKITRKGITGKTLSKLMKDTQRDYQIKSITLRREEPNPIIHCN